MHSSLPKPAGSRQVLSQRRGRVWAIPPRRSLHKRENKRTQCGNDGEGDSPSAPRGLRRDRRFQVPQAAIITQPGVYRHCLEALVRPILETGNFFGIKAVSGFVEDAEALSKLSERGVDCVQECLIGEPQPLACLGCAGLATTPRQLFPMFASALNDAWHSPMIG